MKELIEHKAYEMLKEKYPEVVLDYVILLSDEEYRGIETHIRAVLEAFKIFNTRLVVGNSYNTIITVEMENMSASLSSIQELLQLPEDDYYSGRPKGNRCYAIPKPTPYWYAF